MTANSYHVLGNNETILHEAATERDAREWIKGYTRWDFGGWDFIALHYYGDEENEVIDTFENPAADC